MPCSNGRRHQSPPRGFPLHQAGHRATPTGIVFSCPLPELATGVGRVLVIRSGLVGGLDYDLGHGVEGGQELNEGSQRRVARPGAAELVAPSRDHVDIRSQHSSDEALVVGVFTWDPEAAEFRASAPTVVGKPDPRHHGGGALANTLTSRGPGPADIISVDVSRDCQRKKPRRHDNFAWAIEPMDGR